MTTGLDGCTVWWGDAADASPELAYVLDEDERARWRRLSRAADRALFLVSHALARAVMGALLDVPADAVVFDTRCGRCGGPHGKPRVPGSGIELSISHSGTRVAVAVTTAGPVGVDVERVAEHDIDSIAPDVLSAAELSALAAVPPRDRDVGFLRYWTRKEAVVKATGDGLLVPLRDVVVSAPAAPPRLIAWREGPPPATVRLVDLDAGADYVASLAVLGEIGSLVTREGAVLLGAR